MNKTIKPAGYWTKERCAEEALKYNTRSCLFKKSSSVYTIASRNGWLDDICLHMTEIKKPNGFWTKEKCFEDAVKYKTKTEFSKRSSSAYHTAVKNRWLEEICEKIFIDKKTKGYYNTKERCQKEALKYKTKSDFSKNNIAAYNMARKNGWLNEFGLKSLKGKPYTKEECKEEALKYKTRTEFQKGSRGCRDKALKMGWLDEICSHMIPVGSKHKRMVYAYEFLLPVKAVYVGLTDNILRRDNNHRKDKGHNTVYNYIQKTNQQPDLVPITGYIPVKEAGKIEGETVEKYRSQGWEILNKVKTGGLGGDTLIWTKQKCAEEALKFSNRSNFRIISVGAYNSARTNNWLDEICSHMIVYKQPNGYWTKQKCAEEALKYSSRSTLQKKGRSAYRIAKDNGWLDEICSHMATPERLVKWTKNKCKKEALKFKTRNEFRKFRNTIYNTSIKKGWLDEICSHMVRPVSHNLKWTKEKCAEEALKYTSIIAFHDGKVSAYNSAWKNGWLNEICSHMVRPPQYNLKWTKQKCAEEALKYKTKSEFRKNSGPAYSVSHSNGWLDEISFHMTEDNKTKGYWTKERCKEEALRYTSRSIFKNSCSSAYSTILKNGWIEELCGHMIKWKRINKK